MTEHEVPGREGGIVERVGSKSFRIKAQGFTASGDSLKPAILPMLKTVQYLQVPSTAGGSWFFSGSVLVDDFTMGPEPGRGYPYYSYVLSMTVASGAVSTNISGQSVLITAYDYSGAVNQKLSVIASGAGTLKVGNVWQYSFLTTDGTVSGKGQTLTSGYTFLHSFSFGYINAASGGAQSQYFVSDAVSGDINGNTVWATVSQVSGVFPRPVVLPQVVLDVELFSGLVVSPNGAGSTAATFLYKQAPLN